MADIARTEIPACAAIQHVSGAILAGKRHDICIKAARDLGLSKLDLAVQGFMTTHGRFVDRKKPWNCSGLPGCGAPHMEKHAETFCLVRICTDG